MTRRQHEPCQSSGWVPGGAAGGQHVAEVGIQQQIPPCPPVEDKLPHHPKALGWGCRQQVRLGSLLGEFANTDRTIST
jgi:hypothetical protein